MQARATQASEQLFEKTKSLETSQQETIDQLQAVQDQLQGLKRLVGAQQADAKSWPNRLEVSPARSTRSGNLLRARNPPNHPIRR